jgi:hypothetical protein
MSPLSWPVVIGTLAVGSPALYAAQVSGTLSADVAIVRLGICMAGVWLVCTIVASIVEGTVAANKLAEAAEKATHTDTTTFPGVPGDGADGSHEAA